ncbi:MAG: TraB/GumN family protein [Gammaproteobacteria bacterium]|nr:MAG: TraB/GumN family protein [Gammaproteobacteria bacterium]
MRLNLRAFWSLALLVLSVSVFATPPTPAFWKATSGQNTIYLLGSIHYGARDFYPLPPEIETAFRASDGLFVELDLMKESATIAFKMLTLGALPKDKTIWDFLTPETATLLKEKLSQLGIPEGTVEKVKPWTVSLNLSLLAMNVDHLGLSATYGIDNYFIQQAYKMKLPVHALERVDEQLAVFDGLSYEKQDALLRETLKQLDKNAAQFNELYQSWRKGDVEQLKKIIRGQLSDPDTTDFYNRLTTKRDKRMADRLLAYLAKHPGQYFVVVGAAHLVDDTSLLHHLKRAGYQIERVKLRKGE